MIGNLTELIFILDRSGSMQGLEGDTIGGFNAMLKKQKALPGTCNVTTVLFDDRYELLHQRADLHQVAPLTGKDYSVRGSTALLDAIGRTVENAGRLQKYLPPQERAQQVVVVIITDGMENASTRYDRATIQALVKRQQERHGWEFLFLGANMDAIDAAGQVGIRHDRAARYHADHEGTQLNYAVLSDAIGQVRCAQPMSEDWKDRIDQDYLGRKGDR